jgi:hypothetical protein
MVVALARREFAALAQSQWQDMLEPNLQNTTHVLAIRPKTKLQLNDQAPP